MVSDILQTIAFCVGTVLSYVFFNERDKNKMKEQINKALPKEDVEHLIKLHEAPTKILLGEIAKDIAHLSKSIAEAEVKSEKGRLELQKRLDAITLKLNRFD